MNDPYEALRLRNQLCFPLYLCSKEITRRYQPMLDELDLNDIAGTITAACGRPAADIPDNAEDRGGNHQQTEERQQNAERGMLFCPDRLRGDL